MWPADQVIHQFSFYMALSESPVLGTQAPPVRTVGHVAGWMCAWGARGPLPAQAEPAWDCFSPPVGGVGKLRQRPIPAGRTPGPRAGQHCSRVCPCPPESSRFGHVAPGKWSLVGPVVRTSGNCKDGGCLKIQYEIHVLGSWGHFL